MRVLHLLYPCPQPEKKSKKGKEKSKKQKEKKKEKEQTKKKKEEGKEKKTRGQTPKKKKEEAAEEGDEEEEEEEEEDDEIVLLGKKQARVASAKAEVARMTAAGTGMGRQVRSTLLERDDPMSPDSGKGRSGSGSEPSSSGSSSGSSSTSTSVNSSSNSGDTEHDEPSKLAKTKSALPLSNQRKWSRGRKDRTFSWRPPGVPRVSCLPGQPAKRSIRAAMPTSEVSKSSRSSCRSTTAIWGNWYTITRSVVRRRTTL